MNTPPVRATVATAVRSRKSPQVRTVHATTAEWKRRARSLGSVLLRRSAAIARISGPGIEHQRIAALEDLRRVAVLRLCPGGPPLQRDGGLGLVVHAALMDARHRGHRVEEAAHARGQRAEGHLGVRFAGCAQVRRGHAPRLVDRRLSPRHLDGATDAPRARRSPQSPTRNSPPQMVPSAPYPVPSKQTPMAGPRSTVLGEAAGEVGMVVLDRQARAARSARPSGSRRSPDAGRARRAAAGCRTAPHSAGSNRRTRAAPAQWSRSPRWWLRNARRAVAQRERRLELAAHRERRLGERQRQGDGQGRVAARAAQRQRRAVEDAHHRVVAAGADRRGRAAGRSRRCRRAAPAHRRPRARCGSSRPVPARHHQRGPRTRAGAGGAAGVYGSMIPRSGLPPGATAGDRRAPGRRASSTMGRAGDASRARSSAETAAELLRPGPRSRTISAKGFSSRALRLRSSATASSLRASQQR